MSGDSIRPPHDGPQQPKDGEQRNPELSFLGLSTREQPQSAADKQELQARVEERLGKGDYVAPQNMWASPEITADSLTRTLAASGGTAGFDQSALDRVTDPAMIQYRKLAREATSGITSDEQKVAQQKWDALPEDQRQKIRTELAEMRKPRAIDPDNPFAHPPTPALNAFEKDLSQALKPFEQQREAKFKEVWTGLGEETRRAILTDDTKRPRYQILD